MRRALAAALLLAAAMTAGCGDRIAGHAQAPTAFDPCSLIDVGKLKADGILKYTDLVVSRDVDPVDGRSDWCHAGMRGAAPVSVGVVVGTPFPSLEALLPSFLQQRHQVSVGADKGMIGVSSIGGDRYLVVQHGDVQFMVENSGLGDILGKKLDDGGLVQLAQTMIPQLPQTIPDAPRDIPATCYLLRGIGPVIGPVPLARGRSGEVLTSCDFVADAKHLLLTVSYTKMDADDAAKFKTGDRPAQLTLLAVPLFPGTVSRGFRDNSGMAVETLVDDRILVSTDYKVLCYDNCNKYGVVTPGTTFDANDRALISSAIDVARTMN
ncbi:hypothetical protein [Nocardia heshunensis]